LYAFRIPERFIPGKCDFWFQSHQIFHLFVVAGIYSFYLFIYEFAQTQVLENNYCGKANLTQNLNHVDEKYLKLIINPVNSY
jgi:hypothetical protein